MGQPWTPAEIEALGRIDFSTPDFSEMPGRTKDAIRTKATKLGLRQRNMKFTKDGAKANHDYFSKPNAENSYWAGFIAADGCIVEGRRLQVSINRNDLGHLSRLHASLGLDSKITNGIDNTVKLSVPSTRMTMDLAANFNIGPRKSLTLKPPTNLGVKNARAFMAGYIDGDGCFRYGAQSKTGSWKYLILEVVGTEELLTWMAERLPEKPSIRKTENVFVLSSSCKKAFENYLYLHNPALPLLERKWNNNYRIWSPRAA